MPSRCCVSIAKSGLKNELNKEEALQDFLGSFKTSLNNASVYFKEHPIFIRSIEDLKKKIDSLHKFMNPIKIGIAPRSLFIDGQNWEKVGVYKELASFFHLRKIESIEIREGTSREDLVFFLSKVSLPAKEIFKKGGPEAILDREGVSPLLVKGLDYSQLLGQEGTESKDIWAYLFQGIVRKPDARRLSEFADNFEKIIAKFQVNDLLTNKELQENIYKFISYLQGVDKDKFSHCSQEIARLILKDKLIPRDVPVDKLKVFLKDLSGDELAHTLWEELSADNNFDSLNFNVLRSLLDQKQNSEVAASLADKIRSNELLQSNPLAKKKIKELFSAVGTAADMESYQRSLSGLLKSTVFEETAKQGLEEGPLHRHYRFLILDLLREEKNKTRLLLLSEKLTEELNAILKNADTDCLKIFFDIVRNRKNDTLFNNIFEPFKKGIFNFMERALLDGSLAQGLECFADCQEESSLPSEYYINKIFNERKLNPFTLRLFLRFFPDALAHFCSNLQKKAQDLEFLRNVAQSLGLADSPLSKQILQHMFSFSHILVKMEVLKTMQKLHICPEEFLLPIIRGRDVSLKKEAFSLFLGDEKAERKALDELLGISNPWGLKNKLLLENIGLVIEAKAVHRAREHLLALSKKRFFWNSALRNKAREALEGVYATDS